MRVEWKTKSWIDRHEIRHTHDSLRPGPGKAAATDADVDPNPI